MASGTVKWFNSTKGYGFIKPDAGGADVFVHISAVEKAGYTNLAEGARISYELVTGRPDTRPESRSSGLTMHYTSGTTGRPKGVRRPLGGESRRR